MFIHLVAFKWRSDARATDIQAVMGSMVELRSIPGVLHLYCGPNLAQAGAEDASHAVLVLLSGPEAFETYRSHATHNAIIARLQPILERATIVRMEPE